MITVNKEKVIKILDVAVLADHKVKTEKRFFLKIARELKHVLIGKRIDGLIDSNGISNCLGLFSAEILRSFVFAHMISSIRI